MQQILSALAELATLRSPGPSNCPYIDNVRFVAKDECAVRHIGEQFKLVCDEFRVTLNVEPLNAPHQQGDFLGVHYDMSDKVFVSLPEAQIEKLKRDEWRLFEPKCNLATMEEVMGRLYWASRVLATNTAPFYYALKFARQRLRATEEQPIDPMKLIDLWPSVRSAFREWFETLLKNKPAEVCASGPSEWILFVDASKGGYGAILVNSTTGDTWQISGKWPPRMQKRAEKATAVREYLALLIAVERWLHLFKGQRVTVVEDNTQVLQAAEKGRSPSYALNKGTLGFGRARPKCVRRPDAGADAGRGRARPNPDQTSAPDAGRHQI